MKRYIEPEMNSVKFSVEDIMVSGGGGTTPGEPTVTATESVMQAMSEQYTDMSAGNIATFKWE